MSDVDLDKMRQYEEELKKKIKEHEEAEKLRKEIMELESKMNLMNSFETNFKNNTNVAGHPEKKKKKFLNMDLSDPIKVRNFLIKIVVIVFGSYAIFEAIKSLLR